MAITSIKRDWGVSPSIVRISTTNTISEVSATNYLFDQTAIINALNAGTFQWDTNDFVLVFASDGWDLFTISPDFKSLDTFAIAGAGTVTSITAGTGLTGGTITSTGTIALDVPVTVDHGGTGDTTISAYSVVCGGITDTDPLQTVATLGNSGDVLTSNGAGALPTFQAPVVGVTSAQVQADAFNLGADTGIVDAYVVDLSPVPAAIPNGFKVSFQPVNDNTIFNPTLNVNSFGNKQIFLPNGGDLLAGDMSQFVVAYLEFSNAFNGWILLNAYVSYQTYFISNHDTGSPDVYNAYLPTAVTSYTEGLTVNFNPANTNTGASTFDAGFGAKAIVKQALAALVAGDIVQNTNVVVVYSVTNDNWQLLNPQTSSGVTPAQVQLNAFNRGTDIGAVDHAVVDLSPAPASLTDGLLVSFTPIGANVSTTPDLNLNSFGAIRIGSLNGNLLSPGDLSPADSALLMYSAGFNTWILFNPTVSVAYTPSIQNQAYTYVFDSGSADNYALTLAPAITAYTDGQLFWFRAANNNTGASVVNVSGLGNVAITNPDNSPLAGNSIIAGQFYGIMFNSGSGGFDLINAIQGITSAQIQASTYLVATSNSGSANIYTAAMTPTLASLGVGTKIIFSPIATNTNESGAAPATLAVDATGAINLMISSLDSAAIPVFAGALIAGNAYEAIYDGIQWIVLNPSNLVTGELLVAQSWTYAADSGAVNAYVITLPAVLVNTGVILTGTKVSFSTGNASTGASTITVNGVTNAIVNNKTGAAIGVGDILAGAIYETTFDGANWRLLNSSL